MKNAYTPLNRLTALEEFTLKLFEAIKKVEVDHMDLKARVAALEDQMKIKGVDFGRIYDTLREMEICTGPPAPDETEEQWEAGFIERYGTRENFITVRNKKKEE